MRSLLLCSAVLGCVALLSASFASSQSYVPSPPAWTAAQCPSGQSFITWGNSDASNKTAFPTNVQGTSLGTYWNPYYQYTYTTPFTNTAFGATLYQLRMSLLDNSGLPGPVYLRLGIYLFQEAEVRTMGFNEAALLGQTDEITLYPSKDQVLYANLQTPVVLESEGDYGIGIYASNPIYIAEGPRMSGFSAEGQYMFMTEFYNDYSMPQALLLYPGDKSHPVAATGCLDNNAFNRPNQTVYAFCALIETYRREPANNTQQYVTSLTNVTRYTGVIAIDNTQPNRTAYGVGYPIVYMEGDVQTTTNAGSMYYPPLGIHAQPFTYRLAHPDFPQADDLLYPAYNGSKQIPLDAQGIVITTPRNQTRIYMTNASIDSTVTTQGQFGVVTQTYFSSFEIYPKEDLDSVITGCNVPIGFTYTPDSFSCPAGAAPVSFGDVNLLDLDPLEEDEIYDYLPPNLISFRFFTVWTPGTTAYQLSYFSYSNPEAIVHMRMALFRTNTTYTDSFSALPEYELLEMTAEVELVNVDDTLVVSNLANPVPLTQGNTYAIGVWADALVYGPEARWGVDASGLPLAYSIIDVDGSFPNTVFALGGQTGTQPMGVNACAANQQLVSFTFCATFAQYILVLGQWFLQKRYYSGTVWGLSTPYTNAWGVYHILTAGNGTFVETMVAVPPPPSPHYSAAPFAELKQQRAAYLNGTWNLNNFQVQSQDYFYVNNVQQPGLMLDSNGLQIIVNIANDFDNVVYAVILSAQRPRGGPTWFYQEAVEYDYYDSYTPLPNSAAVFKWTRSTDPAAAPSCPIDYTPWNLITPPSAGLVVACTGLGQMQSTYGDNRVLDYANDQEGNMIQAGVVYTMNFTATAGTLLTQVSLDLLNNTAILDWFVLYVGVYAASNGSLITATSPIFFLEVLDQMVVAYLDPPVYIAQDGLYIVGVLSNTAISVATGTQQTPSMKANPVQGLPYTFKADSVALNIPLTAYGCVLASHTLCASFQYYQGDNYSPVTYNFLYQALIKLGPGGGDNANGHWVPALFGVGHLSVSARIARFPNNWRTGFTDIILSNPGNATSNYIYTSGNGGVPLDTIGLSFLTSDDFGYSLTLAYNASTGAYFDSTNAQLGAELLQLLQLQPLDLSVGVPQCSFLDLPTLILPNTTLVNTTSAVCTAYGADSVPVLWGDDVNADFFYNNEGLFHNVFYLITLTPFPTGPQYSTVTQLALALLQNGNVFAHIRMALYDSNDTFIMATNEVTVDNPRDEILFFTLTQPVLLQPATTYYIAYWTDVSLYTAAGQTYDALCYYGLNYGYDQGGWPVTVGTFEAEMYNCNPLPVAALGCTSAGSPPPVQPACPPQKEESDSGLSLATVVALVLIVALVTVGATLLASRLYAQGKCSRNGQGADDDGDSSSATLRGSETGSTGGSKYSAMD